MTADYLHLYEGLLAAPSPGYSTTKDTKVTKENRK
jgi:hypothetical protein